MKIIYLKCPCDKSNNKKKFQSIKLKKVPLENWQQMWRGNKLKFSMQYRRKHLDLHLRLRLQKTLQADTYSYISVYVLGRAKQSFWSALRPTYVCIFKLQMGLVELCWRHAGSNMVMTWKSNNVKDLEQLESNAYSSKPACGCHSGEVKVPRRRQCLVI